MTSLFEVIASTDDIGPRAVIAAQTRAKSTFGRYAQGDASKLAFIDEDIKRLAAEVADEYGYDDPEKLYFAATVALGGGHASDCSCGFCENKGKLPGASDDESEEDEEKKEAKTAKLAKCPKCGSETVDESGEGKKVACSSCDWEGGYDKASSFKPHMASITPRVIPEFDWEHIAVGNEKKSSVEKLAMAVSKRDFEAIAQILNSNGADPQIAQQIADYFATQNQNFDNDRFMDASGVGQQLPPSVASIVSEAIKLAVEVETGDSYQSEVMDMPSSRDGLGDTGAVPTDKAKSGDQTGWNLKPIDVDSQKHQLEHQDAPERAEYNNTDFDPSNPVRDRIDADKALQPEFTTGPDTKTWSDKATQADPVTSKWKLLT